MATQTYDDVDDDARAMEEYRRMLRRRRISHRQRRLLLKLRREAVNVWAAYERQAAR